MIPANAEGSPRGAHEDDADERLVDIVGHYERPSTAFGVTGPLNSTAHCALLPEGIRSRAAQQASRSKTGRAPINSLPHIAPIRSRRGSGSVRSDGKARKAQFQDPEHGGVEQLAKIRNRLFPACETPLPRAVRVHDPHLSIVALGALSANCSRPHKALLDQPSVDRERLRLADF